MAEYSISPTGDKYKLPKAAHYNKEFKRIKKIVNKRKDNGDEIVVVMGLGFVGAVMAAVVADTDNKFVIGMQRPSVRSFWKIPMINSGVSPVKAEDPEVNEIISRCVNDKKSLIATYTSEVLKLADVVVIDIQCDYIKTKVGQVVDGHADISALKKSFEIIGETIKDDCLVLIETTVPPGTTEKIAYPIIKRGFHDRGITSEPLLSHSFERVMPGKNYVSSIRDFWRVCSGINDESRSRVVNFLSDVLNVDEYPLTVLDKPVESETCKIVENSYRSTVLAFMDEWSRFAELNKVDITKVIDAIKVRPTHSNIMFPGPGIGGYCLPKDGGLGYWANNALFGNEENIFKLSTKAIDINDMRPMRILRLLSDHFIKDKMSDDTIDGITEGIKVGLLGVSYREDVGDTRYSGCELLVRSLLSVNISNIKIHDPYIKTWHEIESQSEYPVKGIDWNNQLSNQNLANDLKMEDTISDTINGADVVILAVRHAEYMNLDPKDVVDMIGNSALIVDCFGLLNDEQIAKYILLGCDVKGLGRGHIDRIKEELQGYNI